MKRAICFVVLSMAASAASGQQYGESGSGTGGSAPMNGTIRYEGTYAFTMSTMHEGSSGSRRAPVEEKSKKSQGPISVELHINGSNVSGFYQALAPLGSESITGIRVGDTCHLRDSNTDWQMHCGADAFSGQAVSFEGTNPAIDIQIEARVIQRAQVAEGARPAAPQGALRPIAAANSRQAPAAREGVPVSSLPMAGEASSKKVEQFVEKDSAGWGFNHFDRGSVHNVRVADGTVDSGNVVLRGEYTYNGGRPGWVLVHLTGGKLACIQFWDAAMGCRALRTPEQGVAMRQAAAGALIGAMSDSSSSSPVDDSDRFNHWVEKNRAEGLNDNGTQKN